MDLPRISRLKPQMFHLEGGHCPACGALFWPMRLRCTDCGSTNQEPVRLSPRGTLLTWTRVMRPPKGYTSEAPYMVGLVRLVDGPVLLAQLTDMALDSVVPMQGMPMEAVIRAIRRDGDDGPILYGYKFRPAFSHYS